MTTSFIVQEVAIPGTNMTVALNLYSLTPGRKSDPKNMHSSPAAQTPSRQAADNEWAWINQTLAEYSKPGSGVGWIFVAEQNQVLCIDNIIYY